MSETYVVEKILAMNTLGDGSKLYKVHWKGWPLSQATWEPIENLQGCLKLVSAFERQLYEPYDSSAELGPPPEKKEKRGRGRPRKKKEAVVEVESKKRGRGRPKKKRGRPKKQKKQGMELLIEVEGEEDEEDMPVKKRGRGRPKKKAKTKKQKQVEEEEEEDEISLFEIPENSSSSSGFVPMRSVRKTKGSGSQREWLLKPRSGGSSRWFTNERAKELYPELLFKFYEKHTAE